MRELTHLSLFSGIGGLDLAAEWAGFKTVGQCEWAEYPAKVLEKHWPDVPRWKDIRTLTGESFYERTGRRTVDIISGGFPCQPFSVAGKQRGKEDDRYLWPEMVRVIKELRPAWVVGENVTGIIKMALPDILSELEACGYRTRAFHIPASGVGARHHRYRVAIVGYTEHNGLPSAEIRRSAGTPGGGQQKGKEKAGEFTGAGRPGHGKVMADTAGEQGRRCERPKLPPDAGTGCKNVQHANGTGCEEQYSSKEPDQEGFPCGRCNAGDICNATGKGLSDGEGQTVGGQGTPEQEPERPSSNVSNSDGGGWVMRGNREFQTAEKTGSGRSDFGIGAEEHEPGQQRPAQSCMGGMADGLPDWVDGYWDIEPDIPRVAKGIANRVERLKALGNAVAPQQFYPIFRAIAKVENQCDRACSEGERYEDW